MTSIINRSSNCSDKKKQFYRWEVSVEKSHDLPLYPEGVKAVFRLIRVNADGLGGNELVILIDNHHPYGFHEHDKLPNDHNSRAVLNVTSWKDALDIFQQKCRRILK